MYVCVWYSLFLTKNKMHTEFLYTAFVVSFPSEFMVMVLKGAM